MQKWILIEPINKSVAYPETPQTSLNGDLSDNS